MVRAGVLAVSILASGFWAGHAPADDEDFGEKLEKRCPAAMREHLEFAKHKGPPAKIDPTRPALARELKSMVTEDQAARQRMIAAMNEKQGELAIDEPARVATETVDARNLARFKHIVRQDGFPTVQMVGFEGVSDAFLLVQHADKDLDFQEQMLKVFSERLLAGGIEGSWYAMLTDRVLTARHKPQRYGTQFEDHAGSYRPQRMEDERHVDARRHALGMISLRNYSCEIELMYHPEQR